MRRGTDGPTDRRTTVRATALCFALATLAACRGPSADAVREQFYVPRGASLAAVTDSLAAHQIIGSRPLFRQYARLRGLAKRVRPGLYQFRRGEKWGTIVTDLASGHTFDQALTIAEGLTVRQIADIVASRARLAHDTVRESIRDSFLAAARDPALLREFGIVPGRDVREPLEGWLLPETYRVAYDTRPRDLVRQMLRQNAALWTGDAERKARELGLTRNEVLTLASIVEAEARVGSERRRIAGVYYNRVRRGMPLQADPTVIYALGAHVNRVLYRHLETRSPYNTYRVRGLPPGPINNPGAASIEAALDPERHGFYFFVARPDGRHMFSRTNGEHADSVAVARVLRAEWQARRDSIAAATRDSLAAARDSVRRIGAGAPAAAKASP